MIAEGFFKKLMPAFRSGMKFIKLQGFLMPQLLLLSGGSDVSFSIFLINAFNQKPHHSP